MRNAIRGFHKRLSILVLAGVLSGAGLSLATLPAATHAAAEGNPTAQIDAMDTDSFWSPEACAGSSDQFRFRLYYHPGQTGAWVNIGHDIDDLEYLDLGDPGPNPLPFCDGTGAGAGQSSANNAGSAYNWFDGYCATVHYSAGYQGASQRFNPNSGGDLNSALHNNDRSVGFGSC